MSTAGQIVGGIVGAVVGFFAYGGPVGAVYGASLGAGIGGALDPPKGPTVEGPRLQDKGIQTSTYGAAVPRIYGTIAGGGNIIQLENNKLKETVRKKSSGGKGGGGSVTTRTYTYSATFQLSLCEGPIAGVRRIWCGDKLIYNAGSADLETIIASNKAAKGFRIYLGTDDQMPDPRYEAEYGVGNVSAHRGEAYIAFYDFQLADYSNTLQAAQFKVEVVKLPAYAAAVLIDVAPYAATTKDWQSGAAYRDDFTGLSYLSERALLKVEVSDLDMGNSRRGLTYSTPYNIHNEWPIGMVSYDGIMWIGIQTNDLSDSNIIKRLSDDYYATIGFNTSFRSVAQKTGFVDVYHILYIPDDGTGGLFSRVGLINVAPAGGILSASMTATPGFRINTCGDQIHEFTASASSISVKTYTDSFVLDKTFSASIPSGGVAPVSAPFPSQGTGTQSCMRDGLFYLCQKSAGGFRIITISTDGDVIADYIVASAVVVSELNSFYMVSATQGYISYDNRVIQFSSYLIAGHSLASVVQSECVTSALILPGDIDVSLLTAEVRGYRVAGGAIRGAIEPLQAAFPFDVRQHGYKIQFLPRGQASVAIVPWEDLGAASGDTPGDILQQSREMDSQLPARTAVKYLDAAREYAISEQYSERLNTEAINRVDRELPLVLTANEAARVAEVLNFLPWLERTDAAFTLPPHYRYLEPGDVVTVAAQQATYELRLTEINETPDGRLECKSKPSRAALYTSAATGAEGVPLTGTIGLGGVSLFLPLDIPVVDETIQNAVGFVGVMTGYTAGWPGALAVRSSDSGQTWTDVQAFVGKTTVGTAVGILPASNCTLIDQRALDIELISGDLNSVTRDQMLSGVNYAAYGLDGRWEIVRFQNATLLADGSYRLSDFVRGDKGTEWAAGLHAAGDYIILLDDPDNAFIGSAVESIGLPRIYRGVTSGDSIDEATDVAFTYKGVNLECLSPVYANGLRDGASNFSGTFTRRSRLSSSWWNNGVVASFGETTESYEIDVMNGATVVRTITAITPAFAYSAANQTTDFGSAQAAINFRIYQISATVGRGYPLEVTL